MRLRFNYWLLISVIAACNLFAKDSLVTDPDPKRFQNEIDNFIQWDKKNSFVNDAVLFVGSSSIRMWKTHSAFPQYPVINRGFGGAHIPDVIFYYDKVIKKYNPGLIVFYCGDNDISSDIPVQQVFDDYLQLIGKIKNDFPDVKFIFISVKPSGSRWEYWHAMNELNEKIEKYNKQDENLFYIDLADPLLNSEDAPNDEFYLNDKLHLSEKGYEVWKSILGKLLDQLYLK